MQNPSQNYTSTRNDLSNFLIHLTKDGSYSKYIPSNRGGYYYVKDVVVAEESLKSIILNLNIEARSSYGYFKLKLKTPNKLKEIVEPSWIKSVCFSETPLIEIKSFYQKTIYKRNDYKKFGLAFWQDKIKDKGGNPIFYFDSKRSDFIQGLDHMLQGNIENFKPMMHLYEGFGPFIGSQNGYSDFRWEREWRKNGDLSFNHSDVAFGICPEDKISHFEDLSNKKIPFIDPDWDNTKIKEHFIKSNSLELLKYF